MRHEVGDRVMSTVELSYSDRTWPAGSPATVKLLVPAGNAYRIVFDGETRLRLVPESQLEPWHGVPEA